MADHTTIEEMMERLVPEMLGIHVRAIWVEWAREQSDPKSSWLIPWDELSEDEREVDRRIGMGIALLVAGPTGEENLRLKAENEELQVEIAELRLALDEREVV